LLPGTLSGVHLSVYAGRAWARLSCALQSAVAQSVINRAPDFEESSVPLFLNDSEDAVASFCLSGPQPDRGLVLAEERESNFIVDSSVSNFILRPSALQFVPSCPDPAFLCPDENKVLVSPIVEVVDVPVADVSLSSPNPDVVHVVANSPIVCTPASAPVNISPTFSSCSFQGALKFSRCPARSSEGQCCPRGSFLSLSSSLGLKP